MSGAAAGKHPDCTAVAVSCDAYADTVPPFVSLWRKFWTDCPFETVLVTETQPFEGFDRVLAVGKCDGWAPRLLKALDGIATPYVLLVLNDYYLDSPVDTGKILSRLEDAKRFNALNVRLEPNPPGRIAHSGTDLLEMPKNSAYCVSCQAGIWDRRFLAGLLANVHSAWEFERFGSFMFDPVEKRPVFVSPRNEFHFIDAVHKGHWTKAGIAVCRENCIDVDFSRRGLPPLRARIVEAAKKAVYAFLPWTLIVRVQNLLSGSGRRRG